MRILLQRVTRASVRVDAELLGSISRGYVLLVGVGIGDTKKDADLVAGKIAHLRLFEDGSDEKKRSALELNSECPTSVQMLVISQFTLFADVRKGRRPSYTNAAPGEVAAPLIDSFVRALRALGFSTTVGRFGAKMEIELVNDGPVTIWLDSHEWTNRV